MIPPGVDPDDLETIVMRPEPKGVWWRCPICGNRFRNDVMGIEPVCTGPNLSLDEHMMEPMVREHG